MTGAGAADVAYAVENSYASLPATPTWKQPFTDIEVGSINITRNLERRRQPDDPRPKESSEGRTVVSAEVSGTMASTDFHELIFPESSNTSLATSGSLAPTATWFFDSDLLSGNADRFPQGVAVTAVTWNYNQDQNTVTVDLSLEGQGGEADLTDPGSISQPSVSDVVPFHGAQLQVNSTTATKLQSFQLDIANMARHRPQPSVDAADAVVGAYEPSLSFTAIPADETHLEFTYGSAGAASTEDTVSTQSATVTFTNVNGTLATYNLTNYQPDEYDWNNLVAADTDLVEVSNNHLSDVAVA